mmetsp:Transcript_1486/g.3796  ORF Transcript_1486/g.3796 Transcript_1486/m.3796 type:complete len:375 (-) Transcript_1486:287-1411(-)
MKVNGGLARTLDHGDQPLRTVKDIFVIFITRIGVSQQYYHTIIVLIQAVQYTPYLFDVQRVSFLLLGVAIRTPAHDVQPKVQHTLAQERETLVELTPSGDAEIVIPVTHVEELEVLRPHPLALHDIGTVVDVVVARQNEGGHGTLSEDGRRALVRALSAFVLLRVHEIAEVDHEFSIVRGESRYVAWHEYFPFVVIVGTVGDEVEGSVGVFSGVLRRLLIELDFRLIRWCIIRLGCQQLGSVADVHNRSLNIIAFVLGILRSPCHGFIIRIHSYWRLFEIIIIISSRRRRYTIVRSYGQLFEFIIAIISINGRSSTTEIKVHGSTFSSTPIHHDQETGSADRGQREDDEYGNPQFGPIAAVPTLLTSHAVVAAE